MKSTIALLLFSLTTSAFSCSGLIGDYVCFDQYSYQQYRKISISEQSLPNGQMGLAVSERGHNRYNRVLNLSGKKSAIEDMTIQSSCNGKTLKVTMKLGRFSETETFKMTKNGMRFSAKEENGSKKLDCERL